MNNSRLLFHLKTSLKLMQRPSYDWMLLQFAFLGIYLFLLEYPLSVFSITLDPVTISFTLSLIFNGLRNAFWMSRSELYTDEQRGLISSVLRFAVVAAFFITGLFVYLKNPYICVQFLSLFSLGNGICYILYKDPQSLGELNRTLIGIENKGDLFAFKYIKATFRISTAIFIQYLVFFQPTENWVPLFFIWGFMNFFFQDFLEQFYIGYVIYERDK